MHILIIHQAFVSPGEPGGTRHYELARHLVHEGHQVTIVGSDLSYLTGRRTAERAPLVSEEILDGIRVLRAFTSPTLHRSFVWRVVSFFSFMLTSLIAGLRAEKVDLVMGTSPPIFQAVSAWLLSVIYRRPFLLEVRDLWPEFAIDMGVLRNAVLITLSRWLEMFLYKRASHILVNSPAYEDYLIQKGVLGEKISLIPNGVDTKDFDPHLSGDGFRGEWGLDGKFIVAYTGAMGLANDIPTILRAADILRDDHRIHLLLVGDGKERNNLEALAQRLNLSNITFTGVKPKVEMPQVLAASDACIATLKDIPMFRTTYPNKVFEYMAAGRPTILAIDGVIRKVMEAAAAGIFVQPGNEVALANAIRILSEENEKTTRMGLAARDYVVKHFNRHEQAQQFLALVERLAGTNQRLKMDNSWYYLWAKRVLDLVITFPALIAFAPMLALIAVLVRLKLGSPVLFCQQRPGLRGRPFTIYKFRTMTETRDGLGNLLPDSKRLNPFGVFIRRTSIDELPEFLNVLKGDMSLVGPRPLLMQYVARYPPQQARRHEVKPGITGWAQVNGRNAITWEDKFKLDVWYVDNASLWLDLKIICMTIWKIIKREGISQPGHATAEEYNP